MAKKIKFKDKELDVDKIDNKWRVLVGDKSNPPHTKLYPQPQKCKED